MDVRSVASRDRRRARFIAGYEFPAGLDAKLARARPDLESSARAEAIEGLREWFQICRSGRRAGFLAMPSQAVDEAWHEFILFTREYVAFCARAFGGYLHHTPAEALAEPSDMDSGLATTWTIACAVEGIDPRSTTRLPRIFALDEEIGMADGMRHRLAARGGDPGLAIPLVIVAGADTGGTVAKPGRETGCGASGGGGGSSCGSGDGGGAGGGCGGGGCGGGG